MAGAHVSRVLVGVSFVEQPPSADASRPLQGRRCDGSDHRGEHQVPGRGPGWWRGLDRLSRTLLSPPLDPEAVPLLRVVVRRRADGAAAAFLIPGSPMPGRGGGCGHRVTAQTLRSG